MSTNNQQQEVIFNKGYEENTFIPGLISFTDLIFLRDQNQSKTFKEEIDLTARVIKRAFDIAFSFTVLVLGLPVYLILMMLTKITSEGPVFYKQQRIGENGVPFNIYKFRSMYVDAEKLGIQTTTDDDPRITKWGNFMRKTHLDELPQFWNVLIGDMSIVGPRPERQYFINQIVRKAPNFRKLQAIKPGITSIGQINFGYAETVDEMCERMTYDLQYLEEVNILTDINIIFETVKTMVQGKGK